ncbi:MAG: hypothetical protein KJ970_16490 [Candidatus Eisenbacteria bacterium]|uniref:WD40 repeat domain-containing protein n=1 Tax=Eiseniibacteriota bacterium TaxID=2212470 RepID=A0A948RX78_UNCEI|nr:hypothetical protein [Candidatus Eisenbacteria bacterium]MBU1947531.1 hypothetical protein [Candidatus Eisenbacteria bacterium]MBU2692520.1 hypothetical protein [Candidatus Eisenbacteria bacterium]
MKPLALYSMLLITAICGACHGANILIDTVNHNTRSVQFICTPSNSIRELLIIDNSGVKVRSFSLGPSDPAYLNRESETRTVSTALGSGRYTMRLTNDDGIESTCNFTLRAPRTTDEEIGVMAGILKWLLPDMSKYQDLVGIYKPLPGCNSDLYLFDINTLNCVGRLTDTGTNIQPSWSPDGKWIAYSSRIGGTYDIWKAQLGGMELRQITDTPKVNEYSPLFSPDGERICHISGENIVTVNAENGQMIDTIKAKRVDSLLKWLCSEDEILCQLTSGGTAVISLKSGELRQTDLLGDQLSYLLATLPNLEEMIVLAETDEEITIKVEAVPKGEVVRSINMLGNLKRPICDPTGQLIVTNG